MGYPLPFSTGNARGLWHTSLWPGRCSVVNPLKGEKRVVKLKGLGRGLDALLAGDSSRPAETLQTLNVALLDPGRYQPRSHMDESNLDQLAESIKVQGVIQPVLVRSLASGRYEIIAGERRWRAAQRAGLIDIPAVVREVPDEVALVMALIENIQREDLNPLEEAGGIQRLIDEFNMTHEQAAQAVGRSRSAVTNLLRLLSLPPAVQALITEGKLDMGHGRALLALSKLKQIEAAQAVAAKQMSVRETERLVARLLKATPARKPLEVDRDVAGLEEELSQKLGTMVAIRPSAKQGAGKLVISYSDLGKLDEILSYLR
jgi:ParB family transcriptional regulator, chromosome partitioning protein